MRKLIFTFLACLSLSLTYAQVDWGAKGGLNVSTLSLNSGVYKPRMGYHAGLYYRQRIEQQYGLQLELQYSLQGARDATIDDRTLNYNYLHLPILLKFYFAQDVFLSVGPQVSYLLKAQTKEEGFKEDITDGVRRWDLALLIGMGKDADFGNFGARFAWGAFNTSGGSVGSNVVYRNLLLQFYVGIKIQDLD